MHLRAILLILLLAAASRAQDGARMTAADALDVDTCRQLADQVMARIEAYTRMKFRRKVPLRVQPKAVWEARLKQEGFGGEIARSGLAFYDIIANSVTVVPWTIGGYLPGPPSKKSREEWLAQLEPIIVHELTHAIHHQNFFVVLGGARQASLKTDGLTEEEKDVSTVEFLSAEGYAELVAHRTATAQGRTQLLRTPRSELSHPRSYMRQYQPNGKVSFRSILSATGYQDGIDILNKITLKAGPRGVRALLYRQPPRALFFQPELLATVDLDDPPEPDSVLGFLSPFALDGGEVTLTVNPGPNRYFLNATSGSERDRAEGCLIGFAAEGGADSGPNGAGRYSFFVADPDKPGNWSEQQAATLKTLNPGGVKEWDKPVPETKAKAHFVQVKVDDGSVYLRGDSGGLVVMAHETKPTGNLEERVLLALGYLELYRPKPHLYDEAEKKAEKVLETD